MTSEELLDSVTELTGLDREAIIRRWSIPYNMVDDLFRYRDRSGQLVQFTPYDYAQDYINTTLTYDDTDVYAVKSRQIGFTTTSEIMAILKLMTYYDTEVAIISHMFDKAAEFVQEAGEHIKNAAVPLPFDKRDIQKTKIKCSDTGTVLMPYSSKPDSIRGGDAVCVIIDECEFIPDQEATMTAVEPKLSRGGQLIMQTTPLRRESPFMNTYNSVLNREMDGIAMFIPLFDPEYIDYSLPPSEQTCAPRCPDINLTRADKIWHKSVDRFKQEYMGIPVDETNAYYPYDLIVNCIMNHMPKEKGTITMGIDHAITRDETAVYVNNEINGANYIVYSEVMDGDLYDQMRNIESIYNMWKPQRIRADATGEMGNQVEIELKKRYGYIVEGVTYTNSIKHEMALRLKYYMQNTQRGVKPCVYLPGDHDLIDQLHNIKIEITEGGVKRIHGKQRGRLDDRVNGLWLCLPEEPHGEPALPAIKGSTTRKHVDAGGIAISTTRTGHRRNRGSPRIGSVRRL